MSKFIVLIACLAPLMGCASFQAFMERDEARVTSWRQGRAESDSVCVVVAQECRYVPREAYAAEKEAIDEMAKNANAAWRKERPHAADLVTAR